MVLLQKTLEAFAVGDAMGMPTEFMTRAYIRERFGYIGEILSPSVSPIHANLRCGQITDDTEQVLYLLDEYSARREISPGATVDALLRWMRETGAADKGYIGPSSKNALERIEKGEAPEIAGQGGTTCGAPMRVLAAVLAAGEQADENELAKAIRCCALPTHNTSVAMEAAAALGFAFHAAWRGSNFDEIVSAVKTGSLRAAGMTDQQYVGATTAARFCHMLPVLEKCGSPEEAMNVIYEVVGTTMEAIEIAPAALCIFAFAGKDVWTAIRMGASIGGDTDTIAAIAAALSALYARGHNIPDEVLDKVITVNNIDFGAYARKIC